MALRVGLIGFHVFEQDLGEIGEREEERSNLFLFSFSSHFFFLFIWNMGWNLKKEGGNSFFFQVLSKGPSTNNNQLRTGTDKGNPTV